MVLSSQQARPESVRRYVSGRRRQQSARRLLLLAVPVLGVTAWAYFSGWGKSASDAAPASTGTGTPPTVMASVLGGAPVAPSQGAAVPGAAVTPTSPGVAPSNLPAKSGDSATPANRAEFISQLKGTLEEMKAAPTPPAPVDGTSAALKGTPAVSATGKSNAPRAAENKPDYFTEAASLTLGGVKSKESASVAATTDATAPSSSASPKVTVAPKVVDSSDKGPIGDTRGPVALASGISDSLANATFTTTGATGLSLRESMSQIADGKLVEGRRNLSKLLADGTLTAIDAQTVRDTLASINRTLVFGDRAVDGDDLVEVYTVQKGEYLGSIAQRYKTTYEFIEQINNISARRMREGQKIKCVKGPFHAVVTKSAFRMDLFLKQADGTPIYIYSFTVGVGKEDSTPVGAFVIRRGGKLPNPAWTHPRTGQFFAADDPKNPIGEYWLPLEGTDPNTKGVRGYGIHGTIEPESVGKQMSLGCVRMLAKDIEQVYRLLVETHSTVTIRE